MEGEQALEDVRFIKNLLEDTDPDYYDLFIDQDLPQICGRQNNLNPGETTLERLVMGNYFRIGIEGSKLDLYSY